MLQVVIPDSFCELSNCQILGAFIPPNLHHLSADIQYLNEEEILRSKQFRFEIDRSRFVIGRNLVRLGIGKIAGQNPQDVQISVEHGRPFCKGTKDAIEFSISHSGEWVCVAFSTRPIGFDIEQIRKIHDMDAVARRVMTEIEYQNYNKLHGSPKTHAFFNLWSRKEAVMKLTHLGFKLSPETLQSDIDHRSESTIWFDKKQISILSDTINSTVFWPESSNRYRWSCAQYEDQFSGSPRLHAAHLCQTGDFTFD
ncbi:MAG: 4'-phosphopantetheinyl transferase superfamily protein [Pseudomonadota bacterium]